MCYHVVIMVKIHNFSKSKEEKKDIVGNDDVQENSNEKLEDSNQVQKEDKKEEQNQEMSSKKFDDFLEEIIRKNDDVLQVRLFNVGKKKLKYRIDDTKFLVIYGLCAYDPIEELCHLELRYRLENNKEIDNHPNFDDIVNNDMNVIDGYNLRSGKFVSGNFSIKDAIVYTKSRYRELFSKIKEKPEKCLKIVEEYIQQNRNLSCFELVKKQKSLKGEEKVNIK